jgi:cell division protein FtsI (penicillin-binding protein 3)
MMPLEEYKRQLSIRSWVIFSSFALLGLAVFGRILWIQSAEHEDWMAIGARYESSVREIAPDRGQIYSRNGSVLATSVPVYRVTWDSRSEAIDWAVFDAELDALCKGLAEVLGERSAAGYRKLLRDGRNLGKRSVLIGSNVPYVAQKKLLELPFIKRGRFASGFVFEREEKRKKPFGALAARTVGIDREEHRVGLEASWNQELAGVTGRQLQRRVSGGAWMPVTNDFIVEPEGGLDLVSTIDMHLQDVASRALESQLIKHRAAWGTVILMETATGRIRAISNLTRDGDGKGEEAPTYHESYNHAIGTAVEPGSTFKLASLIAAMENGGARPDDIVDTGKGRVTFYGKTMSDSNADEGGHGPLTLEEVFEVSSNVGTALTIKKAFDLEPQKFLDGLAQLKVGEPTGVRLLGEAEPQVYQEVGEGNWSGLSLTQMSIGYEVTQTPLQTCALYNAVANRGRWVRPQLVEAVQRNGEIVERFEPEVAPRPLCSERTLAACQRMLEKVADPNGHGTAQYVFKGMPFRVAGKTGTARISEDGGYNKRHRASFAGYFPADNPRYTCIVVIADTQTGIYYGSSIAGPVFRELAWKVYATDPTFHGLTEGNLAQELHLPGAQDGARAELELLYQHLGCDYALNPNAASSDWVSVTTGPDRALLDARPIREGVMPDVRGMGLRDALYLLENTGISVRTHGTGSVRSQSITPGTPLGTYASITLDLS